MSDNSSLSSNNSNLSNIRRRKPYLECSRSQQKRNKELIRRHANDLTIFCAQIGLKIDHIIFSTRDFARDLPRFKISVIPNISKKYKAFACLKAKDLTNMSVRNYKLFRDTVKDILPMDIPGIALVTDMQFRINNIFHINSNDHGFFFNPEQKLRYVVEKYINQNPQFAESENVIKIKISADSVTISKKNIILLNFTFNLIDNASTSSMGVFGTYVFGNCF
jgi:hypothetical protein